MHADIYRVLGWTFGLIAAIFSLGLAQPFARHFYRGAVSFPRRMAAPVIFAALAVACFTGMGLPALIFIALFGSATVVIKLWRSRDDTPAP